MKILVTGINGQVGHALLEQLTDHELIGLTRQDCDLTNPDQIKKVIDHHQPELIINPAAYTKVDKAECEPELAFLINRDAPKVIAEKAREYDIPLIHISTDYVFDGKKKGAYTEEDKTKPLGVYGLSKMAGEEEIQKIGGKFYIFRTSWLYSNIGHNFYLSIKKMINQKKIIRVVNDQYGTPTSSIFVAHQLKKIISYLSKNNTGIYHLVPNGYCSWFDFSRLILQFDITNNENIEILHCLSSYYSAPAKRPKNSWLSNKKIIQTFMLDFSDWKNVFFQFINSAKN